MFDQIKQASEAGFMVRFTYVCVDNVGTSVKRVKQRAYQGGHSGSENTILDIRLKSLGHLLRALNEMGKTIDLLDTFDNSALNSQPRLIASFQARQITHLDPHLPTWLTDALQNTPYSTPDLLSHFHQKQPLPAPPSPR